MQFRIGRSNVLLALTAFGLAALAPQAFATDKSAPATPSAPAPLPQPDQVKSLVVQPTQVELIGSDDARQLILTGTLVNDQLQDYTGSVEYSVADPKIVRVTSGGRIIPLANGSTVVSAQYGPHRVQVPVTVKSMGENLPINFANQIVPIFTKMSCNSGGCHGKISGQGSFRLSLLGFEPEFDYATLVKEGRGRRMFPAAPEQSLFLLKATGAVPHGGGKKLEPNSDEYKLLVRWIAAGMPYGKETDPKITRISVFPEQRVVSRNNRQQVAVYAHYSDGRVEDVTRRTQYESNDPEIAEPDNNAVVHTKKMSGEAAIMARYQGQVAVVRITVPVGGQTPKYQFVERTIVDRHTHNKWKQLGLAPSELASDAEFLRRVSLDLTGTLPTPAKMKAFLNDNDPNKRDKLVDELLETPEYAFYFANKWADILRVKRGPNNNRAFGTFAFHNWIREAIAKDMPYDRFVRAILAASGDEVHNPAVVWYKDLQNPEQFVDDTAQVFLGLRIACANCHHHPYEKWSQDDYWGLAAFFGRVGRKTIQVPAAQDQNANLLAVFNKSNGTVTNKRSNRPAPFKPLDGPEISIGPDDDPRHKLVDWMSEPSNPFFAKAVANRYWAHFFGRGIVDPIDDMRVTNPPSNPELLDALAKTLVDSKYSLKALIKTIVKSSTYQLSAIPNESNKSDKQNYARFYPRRMSAEVLYDAVSQVTNSPAQFGNLPRDQFAPIRAIMLPDESFSSYFLDVFGRPQRLSACECERVNDANLASVLHLLNSDEIQGKLARPGGRVDLLAKDPRPDPEKITEVFLWALGREPTPTDMQHAMSQVQQHAQNKRIAYENIIWALLNTREFIFVR
jgi:hypothetical protein